MSLKIVDASIAELQDALSNGSITSVELLAKYLLRIFIYDCRGPCLNSVPVLNPDIFAEAAASDERRRHGKTLGPLDGIPYTLKDSMKYRGMTCATGSPAVHDLVANEDSFVAEQLRQSGAVCVGRTNTPPFMASGMHRGLYGRAESPYNAHYLTADISGTSTAASFAAFGLGSETVSSGRSPASNNALVAYTPSRGMISPRGVWSLYPTCDVIVQHTRTVKDMLPVLDVLSRNDPRGDEDFWQKQDYVKVPSIERPRNFWDVVTNSIDILNGKKIAVPKMYIGGHDLKAKPTTVSPEIIQLYQQAKLDLESMGATVLETDFPLVSKYEDDSISGESNNVKGFKPGWNSKERVELVAYMWDDFLRDNKDPKYPDLASVDGSQMFPRPAGYIPDRYMEHKNFMYHPRLVELARERNGNSIWELDGIKEALPALEAQRKRDLEDWMDEHGIDIVAFPANGDVGNADLEENDESAKHALQNGVKYSNGNRAIRHMGVPTVSVCLGFLPSAKMPVNITFAGKHGHDVELLKYAYAFEQTTKHRVEPPRTPSLASDTLRKSNEGFPSSTPVPKIKVLTKKRLDGNRIQITGEGENADQNAYSLEVFVDGKAVPDADIRVSGAEWDIESEYIPFKPVTPLYGGVGLVVGNVNIVILVRASGVVAGELVTIPQDS